MAQLIVALDLPTAEEAERCIDELYETDVIFKIGLEGLCGYPERIFAHAEARDVRVFIDVKLHDIPRTVGAAMERLVRPNASIINVHALGGSRMMHAAVDAAAHRAEQLGITRPEIFAVTMLTSMEQRDAEELGLGGDIGGIAMRLAGLARRSGCDGAICSVHEVAALKATYGGNFLALTPGIRPADADAHDQRRVATPCGAVAAGSDYIVVGRPILTAPDRLAATRAILDEIVEARA